MSMTGPNRRHSPSRSVQRKWDDWRSEWPMHFILLPVLVAFAFCLVLFLGSKHGTRLAAMRTWFTTTAPDCRSGPCPQPVAGDSQGGNAAGGLLGSGGTEAARAAALIKISGLLGLDSSKAQPVHPSALSDMGLMSLAPEDALKFDFAHWLVEAEALVGMPSRECEIHYGKTYLEQWRKSRRDWCGTDGSPAAAAAAAGAAAGTLATSTAAAESKAAALALGGRRLNEAKAEGGAASAGAASGPAAGGGKAAAPAGAATPAAAPAGSGASKPTSAAAGSGAAAWGAEAGAAKSGGQRSSQALGPAAVQSWIGLYPFRDQDSNLMFAVAKNTVVDTKPFLGALPGALPEARRGSYRAACRVDNRSAPAAPFMQLDTTRRWISDALQTVDPRSIASACSPGGGNASAPRSSGPVLHPVMVLSRMDPTNGFRTIETAVSAFVNLAVLNDPQLPKKGLQVVMADGKPDGFYLDLWAALSRPYPLRLLAHTPWPAGTCLSHVVHNGYSGASILSSLAVTKRTTCKSPVVVAAALWLRHMLSAAIQPVARTPYSTTQNRAVTRKSVVWISRRNFEGMAQANLTPWQDQRRFSNEGEVVLELQREVWRWNDEACLRSGLPRSFGATQRRQRLHQLRRLTAAVQEGARHDDGTTGAAGGMSYAGHDRGLEEEWAVTAGGADVDSGENVRHAAGESLDDTKSYDDQGRSRRRRGLTAVPRCRQLPVFFDLRVVELNDVPFYPDNLQILGNAAILAGAHGTGLANMVFMPPASSGVLELHHNSAGNDPYHNMARMLGHQYVAVESDGDRVDLPAAAHGLRKLLDALGR